jgi:hypothetical protein
MSDDPNAKAPGQPHPVAVGIIAHWCEHPGCKEWGGFGFNRGKSGVSHWFCGEHRIEGERYL